MPVVRFLNMALSHATAALLAASLVASCEPTSDGTSSASTRSPATAADVSVERVVLQAYRAIGDRHLNEPDFRKMALETYKGFAATDPLLSLQAGDRAFTLLRDGHQVGKVTSACYSPRLEKNIGYAMLPIQLAAPLGQELEVETATGRHRGITVPKPFIDPGKQTPKQ